MKVITHYEAEDGTVWKTEAEARERDEGLARGIKFCDDFIHNSFGLTYASYLVVPRSILQSMPGGWQQKLIALMNEMNSRLPYEDEMDESGRSYSVICKRGGKRAEDRYQQYRHVIWTPEDF